MSTPSPLSSPEASQCGLWISSDNESGHKSSVSPLALSYPVMSPNRSPVETLELQSSPSPSGLSPRSQRSPASYDGYEHMVESDINGIRPFAQNGFICERSDDSTGDPILGVANKSPLQSPRRKPTRTRTRISPKGHIDKHYTKHGGKHSDRSSTSSSGTKPVATASSPCSGSGTASSLDVAPPTPDDGDPNVSLPDIQGKHIILEYDCHDLVSCRKSSGIQERKTSSSRRTSGGRKSSRTGSATAEKVRSRRTSKSKQPGLEIDATETPHRKLSGSKNSGSKTSRRISTTKVAPEIESDIQNRTHAYIKDPKSLFSVSRWHSSSRSEVKQSPPHGRKVSSVTGVEETPVRSGRNRKFLIRRK